MPIDLPYVLPAGQVAIYGEGFQFPSFMYQPNDTNWVYGIVEAVYDGGGVFVYSGDMVMFNKKEIRLVTRVDGAPITITEARLVTLIDPLS
jgi:hypothetical protein